MEKEMRGVKCRWCPEEAVGILDERWPLCMSCLKKACLLILGVGKKIKMRVKEMPERRIGIENQRSHS
ncbi:hypothetical protein ES703_30295 [subsurface metagenome]